MFRALIACAISLFAATPVDATIWIRGYSIPPVEGTPNRLMHAWLDNFEEYGTPEGVGMMIMAHAGSAKYDVESVRVAVERCKAMKIPYKVGLILAIERGNNLDEEIKLENWWSEAVWQRRLDEYIKPLWKLRAPGDDVIVLDIEGYYFPDVPWRPEVTELLEKVYAMRVEEKQKGPGERNDAKLKWLVDMEEFLSSEFRGTRVGRTQPGNYKYPPEHRRKDVVAAMEPLLKWCENPSENERRPESCEVWVMPGGDPYTYFMNAAIHARASKPLGSLDEGSFYLIQKWQKAWLAKDFQALAQIQLEHNQREKETTRFGMKFIPGFLHYLLFDEAANIRSTLDGDVWVFPFGNHDDLGKPEWMKQPIVPE